MNKLSCADTQVLAHAIANLPYSEEYKESAGLAKLLGVKKVEYRRGTGVVQGWDYPDIAIYDNQPPMSYPSYVLLQEVGACNEVWTRLILADVDQAESPEWIRDDILSAMLCYGKKEKEYGVFYREASEGNVEFLLNHITGIKHIYDTYTFLYNMLDVTHSNRR